MENKHELEGILEEYEIRTKRISETANSLKEISQSLKDCYLYPLIISVSAVPIIFGAGILISRYLNK